MSQSTDVADSADKEPRFLNVEVGAWRCYTGQELVAWAPPCGFWFVSRVCMPLISGSHSGCDNLLDDRVYSHAPMLTATATWVPSTSPLFRNCEHVCVLPPPPCSRIHGWLAVIALHVFFNCRRWAPERLGLCAWSTTRPPRNCLLSSP